MTDKEIKLSIEIMQRQKESFKNNKRKARKFLKDAGIINDKGNLKSEYKDLCIPTKQV